MTKPHNRRTIIAYASVLALAGGLTWSLRDVGRAKPEPGWIGRVESVHDGDTLKVQHGEKVETIRLAGIDCPELAQSHGKEARDWLGQLVLGHDVRIKEEGRDRYGRTIADVFLGRLWINQAVVERGLAWHYTAYSTNKELAAAEAEAKAARRGLWADDSPEPPWEFRKRLKTK